MDWQRARGLLLLTFTLVNAILAYALWQPLSSQPVANLGLGTFQLREVQAQLAGQGFYLEATLPRAGRVIPFLRVSPPAPTTTQELFALFEELARAGPGGGQEASWPLPPVVTRGDGTVVFQPERPWGPAVRVESQSALRQAADEFVRRSGVAGAVELRLARVYYTAPGRGVVEYVPVYQGVPIFAGSLRVVIGARGVEEASAFFPRPEGFRGEPKGVLDPTEALLRLAGHLKVGTQTEDGVSFTGVELGYFAQPQFSASAWDTYATWRILTGSGDVYYVNAFTGEVEAP